jgi:hypothetical protein
MKAFLNIENLEDVILSCQFKSVGVTSNWSWELEVDNRQEHHIKNIIKNVRR